MVIFGLYIEFEKAISTQYPSLVTIKRAYVMSHCFDNLINLIVCKFIVRQMNAVISSQLYICDLSDASKFPYSRACLKWPVQYSTN